MPGLDVQGHRGCRGIMPENTIQAMFKALELGVTTLEMDVVITKDRQVLVSHEAFFNHEITTLADGSYLSPGNELKYNIYEMDYEETLQFDVGLKLHPRFPLQEKLRAFKPLLTHLIDAVETYVNDNGLALPYYNLEIKSLPITDNIFHPPPTEFVDLLMEVIKAKTLSDRINIQSFDFRTLKVVHQQYPAIKIAMLIAGFDTRDIDAQINELGFQPPGYSPEHILVDKTLVKTCKAKGLKLVPWTVNELPRIIELLEMGVDGIITDFPALMSEL